VFVSFNDNPGDSWAKADVTISNTEWVGKIQGNEDAYFSLLDNVKAAGISLRTVLTLGIIPEIIDLFPHSEVVTFGVAQLIIDTTTQGADVVTFAANLQFPFEDMIWDVDDWDDADWSGSEFFKPRDIFSIGVDLHLKG